MGGQVKTFVKGSDAVPQLGGEARGYGAIPGKFKYDNELREAGLVTDVEYQKQMIRNGGRGNIIYNNQKVLQIYIQPHFLL